MYLAVTPPLEDETAKRKSSSRPSTCHQGPLT